MADARKKRRSPLLFSQLGIPPGATPTFLNDPAITCVVVADRKVDFEGQVDYPSPAAVKVLRRDYGYRGSEASGSVYWQYEGEALATRRSKLEEKVHD
jgi:hypothetical protein